MKTIRLLLACTALATLNFSLPTAFAQGTAFTYQGVLSQSGVAANGSNDLTFTLYDAASGGNTISTSNTVNDLIMSNGLFTVTLDFGAGAFNGAPRWLQIAGRPGASTGAYTNLVPRQPITATPYAIYAGGANLAGNYGGAVNFTNAANQFSGSGANLTALNASQLASGTVPVGALSNAWRVGGNAGTTPGTHFLGTTDNQPLDFKVNGQRGLRLEQQSDALNESVNVVAGYRSNLVAAGAVGATIAGGGSLNAISGNAPNRVNDDFGTVGGGIGNVAGFFSTVGGGGNNTASASSSAVSGGSANSASGRLATVPGGENNTAGGEYSFAAGRRAKANHDGTFVWADSQNTDFASAGNNQFLIRAFGGVGINTATPGGAFGVQVPISFDGSSATVSIRGEDFTPALVMNGGPAPGILRLRHGLEVWPNTGGTAAGFVDVRDASGAATIVLKGDTGRVGIGTTTPASRLTVKTPAYGIEHTDGSVRLSTYLSGTGGWLGTVSAHDLNFFVNDGGSSLKIGTNGNAIFGGEVTATAVNITSDRNAKEQFKPVNSREVLAKVVGLPISEWQYKQSGEARHIGPVAQDFHAAFAVGRDDKHIATVDADGVALAAIQGLNEKLEEQVRDKDTRMQDLEKAVSELKQLVERLAQQDGGAR